MFMSYLLTGLCSAVFSLYMHGETISAGASGAIFGLYGIFLAFLFFHRIAKEQRKALLTSILIFVGYNLVYGMKAGIDNAAHIGGLLSGFLLGIIYVCSYKFEKADAQRTVSILGELGIFCIFLFSRAKGGILTNYLFQFARILAFCFLGEICHAVLPLPIPASIYGLLLLLAALRFGIVKLEQVKEVGLFLTGIFPLLFVPAAAGVMELWAEMGEMLLPIVIAIIPVTVLVLVSAGRTTQALTSRRAAKKEAEHD